MTQHNSLSPWDCNRATVFVDAMQCAARTTQARHRGRQEPKRRFGALAWTIGLAGGVGLVSMISSIV